MDFRTPISTSGEGDKGFDVGISSPLVEPASYDFFSKKRVASSFPPVKNGASGKPEAP
jgi:hypothetical protein